jgi:hypothetical protein
MRKLFALRTVLSAAFALLVAGSLFAVQACTAGDGTTPTCKPDLNANGNQHLADGCDPFAACRGKGNELNSDAPILPAEECCKDDNGTPFQGQLLKLCLYGYGETVDLTISSASSSSSGAGGGGGGK